MFSESKEIVSGDSDAPVSPMCLFDGHDMGDIDEVVVRVDVVEDRERTCDMEPV